jgi:alkanesulfonate monooxygenase SsuD/methylene tetrahydromethanopterin reductase-like flavin-dependent oxidoreductase (luciferase family)
MKFALFSNDRRPTRPIGEAWDLDIREIVTADESGFSEAWISEHEASADLIICRAAGLTRQIKLGSAVRILPLYHPVQVANDAAACDQLTHGRYLLGVGPGFQPIKLKQRAIAESESRDRSEESLAFLLRILRDPEHIKLDGKYYKGDDVFTGLDFVQKPHPPVALSVANTPASAFTAGKLGLLMITSDFMSAQKLCALGDSFAEGQSAGGFAEDRTPIHGCRVVYVAGTDKEARDDMRDSYNAVIKWEIVNTPWHQYDRIPPGGTLEDITFDDLVDRGNLFVGSAKTVAQMIQDYFVEAGEFGTLNFHCGRDYATPDKFNESLRRFMKEVAPRIGHLTPSTAAARAV